MQHVYYMFDHMHVVLCFANLKIWLSVTLDYEFTAVC